MTNDVNRKNVRKPVMHILKTEPQYLIPVILGDKTFEVRLNDRDYRVGDLVNLQLWYDGTTYPLCSITKQISYILDDSRFVQNGYVVLGLRYYE